MTPHFKSSILNNEIKSLENPNNMGSLCPKSNSFSLHTMLEKEERLRKWSKSMCVLIFPSKFYAKIGYNFPFHLKKLLSIVLRFWLEKWNFVFYSLLSLINKIRPQKTFDYNHFFTACIGRTIWFWSNALFKILIIKQILNTTALFWKDFWAHCALLLIKYTSVHW